MIIKSTAPANPHSKETKTIRSPKGPNESFATPNNPTTQITDKIDRAFFMT